VIAARVDAGSASIHRDAEGAIVGRACLRQEARAHLGELRQVAPGHHDGGALFEVAARDRGAEVAGGAGDERDLLMQAARS